MKCFVRLLLSLLWSSDLISTSLVFSGRIVNYGVLVSLYDISKTRSVI